MEYEYIDVHSHLNFKDFDADREEIIRDMEKVKIGTIIVGTDIQTSREAIVLAEKYKYVFATVGVHPTDVINNIDFTLLRKLALHPRVVAIGECGLDYFREKNEILIERQKFVFKKQIEIAQELNKPLMVHARPRKETQDAYGDVIEILEQEKKIHAHFHFYVGDKTTTVRALQLDATFSFDGPITFSNDYDEVIRMIPIERIMVETDSPFASPKSNRGKRNSPLFVPEIAARITELKQLQLEQIKNALVANARRVFGL